MLLFVLNQLLSHFYIDIIMFICFVIELSLNIKDFRCLIIEEMSHRVRLNKFMNCNHKEIVSDV